MSTKYDGETVWNSTTSSFIVNTAVGMCTTWSRKPANGTQGDTEDKNLVEATIHSDDSPLPLRKGVTMCGVFFLPTPRAVAVRRLTSRRRDRARA